MYDYFTLEVLKKIADATAKKHIKKLKQIIIIAVKKTLLLILFEAEIPMRLFLWNGKKYYQYSGRILVYED